MRVVKAEKLGGAIGQLPDWLITVRTEWVTGWPWRRTTHIKHATWRGHYHEWSNYDTGVSPDMRTHTFLMQQHYVLTKGRKAQE